MKKFYTILLVLFLFNSSNVLGGNCDNEFESLSIKTIRDGYKLHESEYFKLISSCPDQYDAHYVIIKNYITFDTAVPFMALMWLNTIDYKSNFAKQNIQKMDHLLHRYITTSDKVKYVAHVPPAYVRDWDSTFINNMSPLEAGLIVSGAFDFSRQDFKSVNSAERLQKRMEFIFQKIEDMRKKYKGFFWDFYVGFWADLYKTDHSKTAMYLIMYRTKEKEIITWINNNKDKVEAFYSWRSEYLNRQFKN